MAVLEIYAGHRLRSVRQSRSRGIGTGRGGWAWWSHCTCGWVSWKAKTEAEAQMEHADHAYPLKDDTTILIAMRRSLMARGL